MMSAFIAVRALVFASAFMGLWFWVILRLLPVSRTWDAALPVWIAVPGIVLGAAGSIGIGVCVALFVVHGRGTPAVFDAPRKFVAVGPYRYVRNPMYLGAVAIFSGFGMYARSLAVLGFVAAWFLLAHLFVVFVEEPGLRRRFGRTYEEYCRRVHRWVPRIGLTLSIALVLVVPTLAQQPPENFTGTWTLNLLRSDYGPLPAPDQRTDVIEHRGSRLRVTRREVRSGGQERSGEWSCSTDRVECTNTISGTELKSAVHWEGSVLVVETKTTYQGQDAFLEDRWTLSPDRRVLTISRHAVSVQGTADQTFVLERR